MGFGKYDVEEVVELNWQGKASIYSQAESALKRKKAGNYCLKGGCVLNGAYFDHPLPMADRIRIFI